MKVLGQRQQCSSHAVETPQKPPAPCRIYKDGRGRVIDRPERSKVGESTSSVSMYGLLAGSALVAAASARAIAIRQTNETTCPGYSASNVQQSGTGLSADLTLAGAPCNSYGNDIENLRLTVSYDTCMSSLAKIDRCH